MDRKTKRRTALIASIVVIGAAVGYLVLGNFQDSLVYFYTPTELMDQQVKLEGKKVRLAGLVMPGSVTREADRRELRFALTDATTTVPVVYTGVVPDLFAEGQMAVAEGRLRKGDAFKAELIMAKHSEDYDTKKVKRKHARDLTKAEKW
jgi:cytochrome c-type biogenesis protein CcmE